jgi:hypothetical protein
MQRRQFKLSQHVLLQRAEYKKLIYSFDIYVRYKNFKEKLSDHDDDRHQFYNERDELVFKKLSSIRTKKWKLSEYVTRRATFQLARSRGKYRKRGEKLSTIAEPNDYE